MAFSRNDIKNTVLEIDKHGTQQKMAPCKNSTPCIKMPKDYLLWTEWFFKENS